MRGAKAVSGLGFLLAFGFFVSLAAVRCTYSPDFPSGELRCSTVQSCPEGYSCFRPNNLCYKPGELPGGAAGTGGTAGATGTAGAGGHGGNAGTGGHGGATGTAGMGGTGGATGTAGMGGAGGTAGVGGAGGHAGAGGGPPCAGTCTIKIDGTLVNSMAASPDSKFVGHWVFQAGSTEMVACSDGSDKTSDLSTDYVDVAIISGTLTGSYFCDWALMPGPLGNATVIKAGQSCSRNVNDAKTGLTKFTWHGVTFTLKTDDSKNATLTSMINVEYVDDPTKTGCSP
jgi:hypothetical protein